MNHRHGARSRLVVAIVATVLAGGAAFVALPAVPAGAATVTYPNTPIASDRVNGVGWATLIVGDTIYLGGQFTQVRGDNGAVIANRANIVAYNASTGRMRQAFNANTDGVVYTLATDGQKLFIGGAFNTVNGVQRNRVAAVDLATGALRTDWAANATGVVYALSVGGGHLYAGGEFGQVKGVGRSRVAALSLANGDVVTSFSAAPNNTVSAVRALPDGSRVFVGGSFTQIGGGTRSYLVALDGTSGALVNPIMASVADPVIALDTNAANTRLAAGIAGRSNRGQYINITTGARLWFQQCGGDAQAVSVVEDSMFTGFHEECNSDFTIRLVNNAVANGVRDMSFIPTFDRFWGVRGLDGAAATLAVAGDFTNVGGRAVQGLAIFRSGLTPPPTTTTTSTTLPSPAPVNFPLGSSWKYLANNTDQGTAWRAVGFGDGSWSTGNGQLGFGDGDEATTIGLATNHVPAFYFRRTFNASAVPSSLTLRMIADDGAVVYLNGTEVARDNMPAGSIGFTTLAATNRSGAAENAVRTFTLPATLIHVGANVIAVEVHQDATNSSDTSFDASLASTP